MIKYPRCKTDTNYSIPNSITSIGKYAFHICESLTSITIPDSVTSIGNYAFGYCRSLKSITIPNSVTSIGYYAFSGCERLTSITIPNSVTSIGDYAFSYCYSLTSITIPDSVTSIGDYAFSYCSMLKTVYYRGTSVDRSKIYIGSDNSYLTKATWYYNSCIGNVTHTYDSNCDDMCNNCGEIRTTTHTYSNECDRDCNVCGEFRRAPHLYDNACDDSCGLCNVEREVPDHVYDNACDTACNECGAERQVPDHEYDNACDTTCNACSFTRTAPHYFEWIIDTENNCGVNGSKHEECTVCHTKQSVNTVINATGDHKYDNACDTTCNECGNIREVPDHIYDNVCDAVCNICGELRTPPHRGNGFSCDFANATNYPFSLSGNIYSSTNKSHSSSATATITAKQSGTLTIKYYTSTESNYDKLIIKLNSTTKVTASGETDWTAINIPVVEGDKIYITYSKDSSVSNGDDIVKFELNQKSRKSCDEPLLCLDCNEILEYPEEHEYDDGSDMECNKCGVIRTCNHVYGNSCDVDCNLCGFIRTVEHTFTNECDNECDICYETRKAPHKYDGACDSECNLCGKTRTVPDHSYGDDLVCDECGYKNFVLGDIDGTGEVDLTDVNVLAQQLAGWYVEVNDAALDTDGDGLVNLKDLIHLAQYVAGWEGIVLK